MTGGSAPAGGATKRTGMPDAHGVERDARQPAQERDAFGHAGHGHDVGRLGGEPGGRHADDGVGRDLAVAAERGAAPALALAVGADGLRRDGERAAAGAALDGQAPLADPVEELPRGHAAGRSAGAVTVPPARSPGVPAEEAHEHGRRVPAERVGQPDPGALDLASSRLAAQLRGDLGHLRRARRPDRVTLGLEPPGRVDGDPPPEARLALLRRDPARRRPRRAPALPWPRSRRS